MGPSRGKKASGDVNEAISNYKKALESVEKGEDVEYVPVHVCSVCGFTVEGDAPDQCPVCGSPKDKFKEF